MRTEAPLNPAERRRQVASILARGVIRQRRQTKLAGLVVTAAREALAREQELLATTLASIGDAVITTDAEARVTYLNAVAESLTGWKHNDAVGQPLEAVFRIVNEQSRRSVENPAIRSLREGTIVGLANHTVLIRKDESELPIDDSAAPIRDRGNQVVGSVLVFRDITQRRLAEDERRRLLDSERAARTEAEQASRTKDEFLATLSHELRTPLNAILGWSRLIQNTPGDTKTVSEGVHVIVRNAKAQAELISDLLDMSRIVSGKLRLDISDVNLSAVVAAAVDAVRLGADSKGIQIESIHSEALDTVRGDASRLQQVVVNLLSNAVKFTPSGGRISIVTAKKNSHAEIVVNDTGAGIRPELLPHLFERFRQGDASAARRHGGLGLGLAIVKHLVELHGGSVRAKSDGEGFGATFTVELPVVAVQEREAADLKTTDQRCEARLIVCNEYDFSGIQVLTIDDQADTRKLVARVLEECHAAVIVASSADEGLQALEQHRVQIVLCDIGMPDKSGYDFIKAMRERGYTTPALAVTAFARSDDKLRVLRAGFQGHIAKPVEPSELLATVAVFVRPPAGGKQR